MGKALQTLDLTPEQEDLSKQKKISKKPSKYLPSQNTTKHQTVILPDSFKSIVDAEWRQPSRIRWAPESICKMYSLTPEDSDPEFI